MKALLDEEHLLDALAGLVQGLPYPVISGA